MIKATRPQKIGSMVFLMILALGFAAPFTAHGLAAPDQLKREYVIKTVESGPDDEASRRLFDAVVFTTWTTGSTLDGRPVLVFHREERTHDGDRVLWKFFVEPGSLNLLSSEKKIINREGKPVQEYRDHYENAPKPYPPRTFHFQMIPFLAQHLPVTAPTKINFVFNTEMLPWQASLIPDGEETLRVPAGTFACRRLKLEYAKDDLPSFFKYMPSALLDKFLSGYLIWVQKDPPHAMVRFQGKLSGFSAPTKAQDLARISEAPKPSPPPAEPAE